MDIFREGPIFLNLESKWHPTMGTTKSFQVSKSFSTSMYKSLHPLHIERYLKDVSRPFALAVFVVDMWIVDRTLPQ